MLKNKSLLGKFLILLCAFCCSLALMLGITGCADGKDGQDGKDGKDGVGIEKVAFNEKGELIVTYTDGTTGNAGALKGGTSGKGIVSMKIDGNKLVVTYDDTTSDTLELPQSGVSCNHEFYEYELEKHTYDEENKKVIDGVILQVCKKDCGTAYIKNGAIHEMAEEVVAPTCTEDGYTTYHCTVCGYEEEHTNIVPATGHNFDKDEDWHNWHFVEEYVTVDGERVLVNVCENGGMRVRVCETCNYVEYTKVEATGHHSDHWEVTTVPTDTTEGVLSGLCGLCGQHKTVKLPAFKKDGKINEAYTYEVTTPKKSCEDTNGKATYTITVDDQPFPFEVSLPATEHVLNGVEMPDKNADGAFIVYDVKKYAGLTLAVNPENKETCAESGADYVFICEECGGPVIVKGTIDHTKPVDAKETTEAFPGDEAADKTKIYVVPATCTDAGSKTYYCSACEQWVPETVEALGHDYAYELKNIVTGSDGKVSGTLVGTCKRDASHTTSVEAKDITVETVEPTCETVGSKTYKYTYNGKDYTIVETIDKTSHFLNGEAFDDSVVYEWTEELQKKGVELAANTGNVLTCNDDGANAVFTCSKCGGPVIIRVKVSHKKPVVETNTPAESVEAAQALLADAANRTKVYEVAATCTKNGAIVYYCSVCEKVVPPEEIAALGHSVVTTLTKNDDGTFTLTSECKNEGCEDATVNFTKTVEDVKEEIVKVASCNEKGQVKYTYTDPDTTKQVTLTLETAFAAHTIKDGEGKEIAMPDDEVHEFDTVKDLGVELAVNPGNEFGCQSQPANAVFTCSHCGGPVIIKVSGPHKAADGAERQTVATEADIPAKEDMDANVIYVVPASCTQRAVEAYLCQYCGEPVKIYANANGHEFTYTTTEPTLAAAGAVTVGCKNCDYTDTITLPKLDDKAYTKTVESEATCQNQGVEKYAYTYVDDKTSPKGYEYSETFTVVLPMSEHKLGDTLYAWEDATYEYTGKICEYCGNMVMQSKEFRLLPTLSDTYLEVVDGKVLYVVTGTYQGDPKGNAHAIAFDLENGGNYLVAPEQTTFTTSVGEDGKQYFKLTADVTAMNYTEQSASFFPHLYVLGEKYKDSAMANASKKGTQYVTLNGVAYVITQKSGTPSWNMPVLSKPTSRINMSVSLEENEGRAYYVINGILGKVTAAEFEALNYVFDFQQNPNIDTGITWQRVNEKGEEAGWSQNGLFASTHIKKVANADGTFKIMIDVTDMAATGYTYLPHGGVDTVGDIKLGGNGQTLTVNGKKYTVVVDSAKGFSSSSLKVEAAA